NLLTPLSLKVRLARIRYEDIKMTQQPALTRYAFFIEDGSDAAKRLDLKRDKQAGLDYTQFEKKSFAKTVLFAFMIGHGDWRIDEIGRPYNSKAYRGVNNELFLVLYDFDRTEIMGDGRSPFLGLRAGVPGYTRIPPGIPSEYFGISPDDLERLRIEEMKVKEKLFCLTDEEIRELIAHFVSFKGKALGLFANDPILKTKLKNHSLSVLTDFFTLLEHPKEELPFLKSTCASH
ncbi:MAG: hypothetical protein KDD34_06485, partial [Bdellovibrionales bacterium]|nr:hypothetical protein [Bdellovibrionales bacterium]